MEYWVDGVLRHSLHNEVLISLGKKPIDKLVDAPWKYSVEVSDTSCLTLLEERDVSAIYDTTGLLLILGEPGSGKTTTLLDLARTLLDRARDDIRERVPIVLNLSSWQKGQPLTEWIGSELSEKYRWPVKFARSWLQNDYLVPLLDALDEVPVGLRPDCVAAINDFIEKSIPSGIVVCCRLMEYQWLPHRLKLNGAICLEPLSPEEVGKYLDRGGSKFAGLRDAVDRDPVLKGLAQTPLMLSIMSLACQGASGDELAKQKGNSAEERRKQIFGLYVEQMFQRKGMTSLVFPKEKIIGWLSWLARKMREHSQSEFLVEALQPSWLGSTAQRAAYGTIVALSLGLIFGLICGLIVLPVAVGLGCWSESRLKNGVMSGSIGLILASIGVLIGVLIGGPIRGPSGGPRDEVMLISVSSIMLGIALLVGLIGGLGVGSLNRITLVETMSWKWNQFWKRTIPGSIVGLIFGLFYGLIFGLIVGLNRGGSAVIKHYALRLTLWRSGYTPFRFINFLDHCARLILLKRVGGGYIFIHRMLLEYFAELNPQPPKAEDGQKAKGVRRELGQDNTAAKLL